MKAIESVATIDGPYAGFAFDDGEEDDDGTEYDESEEEEEQRPPAPERKQQPKKEAPIRNWRKKYNTIMQRRTELRNDDDEDDDVSSLDRSTRDMTIESRDSSGYGSFRFDDTLNSSASRDRVDTTIEIPEKKKSMTKLVPRTNTSDVNSTYGSFQFDDTLKSKDVSLVSKLRDLVERMDFMEKSVMVRLDRIEKRLTRLEEEKDNGTTMEQV